MRIRHNLSCLQSQGLGCTRKYLVTLCYKNPGKPVGFLGHKSLRCCWDSCADFAQCSCKCKHSVYTRSSGPYTIGERMSRATGLRFDALRGDIRASEGLPHARTFGEHRRPVYGFLWPPRGYRGYPGLSTNERGGLAAPSLSCSSFVPPVKRFPACSAPSRTPSPLRRTHRRP